MAEITAGMVKELREATGLGMMDCKKALVDTNGDFKAAEELLRIKSGAKASKASSRVAAERLMAKSAQSWKLTAKLTLWLKMTTLSRLPTAWHKLWSRMIRPMWKHWPIW
jgi:hypothetical protein